MRTELKKFIVDKVWFNEVSHTEFHIYPWLPSGVGGTEVFRFFARDDSAVEPKNPQFQKSVKQIEQTYCRKHIKVCLHKC